MRCPVKDTPRPFPLPHRETPDKYFALHYILRHWERRLSPDSLPVLFMNLALMPAEAVCALRDKIESGQTVEDTWKAHRRPGG